MIQNKPAKYVRRKFQTQHQPAKYILQNTTAHKQKILQYKHNPNTQEYKYITNLHKQRLLPHLHSNADIHFSFFTSIQHPILALK